METEINADAYESSYFRTKPKRLLASLDVYSLAPPVIECTLHYDILEIWWVF
jgi:hypothetical protein